MDELKRIKREVEPAEIMLVVDAMTGQDAVNVAKSLGIDGMMLTKLDGDTRGGAALSIRAVAETRLNSVASEKNRKIWSHFIPTVWLPVFLGWEICFLLLKKPNKHSMKSKPLNWKKKLCKTDLTSTIISTI